MTRFRIGQMVTASSAAQGLTQGTPYMVDDVIENLTPFGNFTTYVLRREDGERFAIANGHLVLEAA